MVNYFDRLKRSNDDDDDGWLVVNQNVMIKTQIVYNK